MCPPGFSCLSGSAAPRPCLPGFFAGEASLPKCEACSAGTYQPAKSATGCIACPQGSFCPTGSALPRPCPAGSFGDDSGLGEAGDCTPCPAGHYCVTGSPQPEPCPAGRYGGEIGLQDAACSGECAEGSYCPSGATTRTSQPCPEGTYNRLAGGTSLEASCKECPLGKFCGLGTTVPTFCPAGTVDRANAVGAGGPDSCECQPGFYLADAMPDVADWACKRCPSNAACDSTTRLSMLSIEPGYWRLSNETDDLHRCRENAEGWSPCLGGASGGDASCTIGHHGPLCQLCQPEHYFSRPDAACRACGDVTASILKIAALLALCAVMVGAFRALVLSRWIPEAGGASRLG